jgi:NADH-quinone oxidoreductase subunit G
VALLNPARFPYYFPVRAYLTSSPDDMVADLAAVLGAAAAAAGKTPPAALAAAVQSAPANDEHRAIAQALLNGERRAVWLGALATRHPAFADLRALAAAIAEVCGATLGQITEGANAAGAYLAGAVPHREAGGKPVARPGCSARDMLTDPPRACVLFGGIEPSIDTLDPDAGRALARCEFIVALTPFASEEVRRIAHVILPIGTFAETSGTYVNCEGVWQSQSGAAAPVGTARPGWKVLRVLGNLLNIAGFDYQSSGDVLAEVRRACGAQPSDAYHGSRAVTPRGNGAADAAPAQVTDVPMYQIDALVRRAPSLQKTREGRTPATTY